MISGTWPIPRIGTSFAATRGLGEIGCDEEIHLPWSG
jgi:hypothetical protein